MPLGDRNFIFQKFGWWIRLYKGSTSKPKRLWRWKFIGITGYNHGITLRLKGETCLGLQWRRTLSD